ncbi:3241_t:CDS:1 [Acaulospora colombiana]|uniref:3241_t:CDS:1 n=1 Tax=Acaulospora colombiana TaxID=27376 RepID=A0ACA9LWK3_9GLOM|nr:3241_t:CDS:1 [Acaulospora colombiana]
MESFYNLPSECLREIFSCLENEYSTLYNCLFVSRTWCRQVVSILWRNPFRHKTFRPSPFFKQNNNSYSLCTTYLSALNEEEKKILHPYDSRHNLPPPLFQYSSYLEKFSFENIEAIAESWIKHEEAFEIPHDECCNRIKLIMAAILQLFLRTSCPKDVRVSYGYRSYDILGGIPFSSYQPGFSRLINLAVGVTGFHPTPNLIELLKILPKLSTNLKGLEFVFDEDLYQEQSVIDLLIDIMTAQSNLKKISLEISSDFYSPTTKKFISALNCQKESLTSLSLYNVDFSSVSLNGIAECTLLESMEIYYCRGAKNHSCAKFLQSPIQLKSLAFDGNDFKDVTLIPAFVEKAGKTLVCLSIDNLSDETIKTLMKCCPNLTDFTLLCNDQELDAFLDYLKGSNISKLTVDSSEICDSTELLEVLGDYIPRNLEKINLFSSFSPDSFERFLSDYYKSTSKSLRTLCIKDVTGDNYPKYLKAIESHAVFGTTLKTVLISSTVEITEEISILLRNIKRLRINASFVEDF